MKANILPDANLSCYFVAENDREIFKQELAWHGLEPLLATDGLYLLQAAQVPLRWFQWKKDQVQILPVQSIQGAKKILVDMGLELKKTLGSFQWCNQAQHLHRRTQLLIDSLPRGLFCDPLALHNSAFNCSLEDPSAEMFKRLSPWGYFAWMDQKHLLIAFDQAKDLWPLGLYPLAENKSAPPSRAYLKLWEALLRGRVMPKKNDLVVDLGACPGGWTWAMSNFATQVISVDRSPLDQSLAKRQVHFHQGSAFQWNPRFFFAPQLQKTLPKLWRNRAPDWIISDVICYPEKLLQLIEQWLKWNQENPQEKVRDFICTLKFQGNTDFKQIKAWNELSATVDSQVVHLHHNKHELCWIAHT